MRALNLGRPGHEGVLLTLSPLIPIDARPDLPTTWSFVSKGDARLDLPMMPPPKIVPDAIDYNAVIYACGKGKQPELPGKCSRH